MVIRPHGGVLPTITPSKSYFDKVVVLETHTWIKGDRTEYDSGTQRVRIDYHRDEDDGSYSFIHQKKDKLNGVAHNLPSIKRIKSKRKCKQMIFWSMKNEQRNTVEHPNVAFLRFQAKRTLDN